MDRHGNFLMEHTLQDFELVLRALQNVKEPHAWVGGQAVIVWANRYLRQAEIESTGLQVPLSSKDGDLKANAIVAKFLAKELGAKKQDYRLKDESRGMAWGLIVSLNGQQVLFDILEKLPGVDDPVYVHTVSVGPRENRLTAKVVDPVSLLINKADVWRREKDKQAAPNRAVRHDREHLTMLGMLLPKYLIELEGWQKVHGAASLERQVDRLRSFLDSNPELPGSIGDDLRRALTDGGHHGGSSPLSL